MQSIRITQVLHFWFIYVLIDLFLYGVLFHFYLVTLSVDVTRKIYEIGTLPMFVLAIFWVKIMIVPQYPIMFIGLCLTRNWKKALSWCWALLPVASFILAYSLFALLLVVTDYYERPFEVVLREELDEWLEYQIAWNGQRSIALISAIIATFFWMPFLKRKIRSTQGKKVEKA